MKGEKYILKVSKLNVAYNNNIVIRDFSMQLLRGELVAITGASGSGKSSLLRALMGFVPLTSGEVVFDETPIRMSLGKLCEFVIDREA